MLENFKYFIRVLFVLIYKNLCVLYLQSEYEIFMTFIEMKIKVQKLKLKLSIRWNFSFFGVSKLN